MPVRIQDVASAAGVSTATVSRALRGLPSVSPETREAVTRTARELGYVVSRSASTLASGRTMAVAVLTPYVSRWYFAEALEAVERELRGAGYDALLVGVGPRLAGTAPFVPGALRRRVDAVVVLTVPLAGSELDALRSLGLPLVFIGAAVPGAACVRVDDVAIGRRATEHLLELGHSHIAHIGGNLEEALNFHAPGDRRAGWLAAQRRAGIEPAAGLEVAGLFTMAGGYRAMEQLLELPAPPSAVFASSDEMAFGALAAARERGLAVPGDLSIVGVDDHDYAAVVGLTTVTQPVRQQGALAAQLALAALSGRARHPLDDVLLPTELVVRRSTGPPKRGRRGARRVAS